MVIDQREQGETRRQILELLRRRGQMTAAELSDVLGIGAVGVRQHLALLERDNLVHTVGVRRGMGRPSHLFALTAAADALFPHRYDHFAMDALAYVQALGGADAVEQLFTQRRAKLRAQLQAHIAGQPFEQQVIRLAEMLTEQGYMCECEQHSDGSFELIEHNCPVDCVARDFPQACSHEVTLYEEVLGVPVTQETTIARGANSCRYRIMPPQERET